MSTFDWGSIDFIEIDWNIEPRVIATRFNTFARTVQSDFDRPAIAARQIIMDDVQEHFEKWEEPDGTPWKPWAPTYAPVAERENIGMLRKTDDLYESVMQISSFPVIGDDVWVNTNSWPDYWRIHQEGGLIMSAPTMIRRMVKTRSGHEGARDHGRIPARPYIGVSADAEARIFEVYELWFEGELGILVSGLTGLAQEFTPGPGGIGGRIGFR